MEPQPPNRIREKVLIGLENAPPSFDVRGKVMGPGGANLQYITNETGVIVTVRGRGSGYIEPTTGAESIEPLHLCVEHSRYEVLQAGRQLAFNLIETVQQEWAHFQQQQQNQGNQAQQQQIQQPMTIQLQQPPGNFVVNGGNPGMVSLGPGNGVGGGPPENGQGGLVTSVTVPVFSQQPMGQIVNVPPPAIIPPPGMMPGQPPLQVGMHGQPGPQYQQQGPQPSLTPTSQGPQVSSSNSQPSQEGSGQQVYVSQGQILTQPPLQASVLPQNSIMTQQPQIVQAYHPVQYVPTNGGQMVVAYPNVVRPGGEAGQQVMLLQYQQQQAAQMRQPGPRQLAPATTVLQPQLVQIVNAQGQVQHVIQHVPAPAGTQVLMPAQPQLLTQFVQPQQMLLTQPQQTLLNQQQVMGGPQQLPQVGMAPSTSSPCSPLVSSQSSIPQVPNQSISSPVSVTSTSSPGAGPNGGQPHFNRPLQGQKRRFEGEAHPHFQGIPQMSHGPHPGGVVNGAMHPQHPARKGLGNDMGSRGGGHGMQNVATERSQNPPGNQQQTSGAWKEGEQMMEQSKNLNLESNKDQVKRGRPGVQQQDGSYVTKDGSRGQQQIPYNQFPTKGQMYSPQSPYHMQPQFNGPGTQGGQQQQFHPYYQQNQYPQQPYNHWMMPPQ